MNQSQTSEDDRNALENIISEIVSKSNAEFKERRQKLAINAAVKKDTTDTKDGTEAKEIFTAVQSKITPYIVTDTLAAFVLRSVAMNPENEFNVDMEFSPEEVERLISLCVERIINENCSPQMETVKMQVYFDTHFPAQCI